MKLHWTSTRTSKPTIFDGLHADGRPLLFRGGPLLTVEARLATDPSKTWPVELEHLQMRARLSNSDDLLTAVATVRNPLSRPVTIMLEFSTMAQPSPAVGSTRASLPLTANGTCRHGALVELGQDMLADGEVLIGCAGQNAPGLVAHYREPAAVEPEELTTRAQLLIPLVTWHQPSAQPRLSLWTSPERPWRFAWNGTARGSPSWRVRTRITLAPGKTITERAWFLVHSGEADEAWEVFHRVVQKEEHPRIAWLDEVRVHYYDFLSPGGDQPQRGEGYERALPYFKPFHVGLATQHGYYPHFGDYIHPDRHEWLAMRGDAGGNVPMSLEKIRNRIKATRKAGARAAIYIHIGCFDRASSLDRRLRDSMRQKQNGKPVPYPWDGPDMEGEARFMSIRAPGWRSHLLQQTEWIFELLAPDAIVIDETFAGLGYDWHPRRAGPSSGDMISFLRDMRSVARSFGRDKAILTSDCGLANFVMWADGEGGDHAYASLLGHELYRRTPVRYLAALGDRPWLPCAWQFNPFWEDQMDLARKTGAGVGVANGWIDYTGLDLLPPRRAAQMRNDIASLLRSSRPTFPLKPNQVKKAVNPTADGHASSMPPIFNPSSP